MNCFLLVTILPETWFSLPTLVVDPAVGVFDVIALEAEEGGIGVGEGEGAGVGHVVAPGIVVAGHEAVLIHKGDVPKGHVADDVMLHGCSLVIVDAGDAGQEGLASIFTNAHHSPREISVEFCYAMSLIIPVCKN